MVDFEMWWIKNEAQCDGQPMDSRGARWTPHDGMESSDGLSNGQLTMDWMGRLNNGQLVMGRLARDGQLGRAWQWTACNRNGLDGDSLRWTGSHAMDSLDRLGNGRLAIAMDWMGRLGNGLYGNGWQWIKMDWIQARARWTARTGLAKDGL